MSTARETILARIRGSLDVPEKDFKRENAVKQRLRKHASNLIPDRSEGSDDDRVALFRKMLEACDADVIEIAALENLPTEMAAYLREHNLPAELHHGGDPVFERLDWDKAPAISRRSGRANGDEVVGLSRAEQGIAETGTLMLRSGPDNPTTINFLPETHIVLVGRGDIVGPYERAWDRVRSIYGEGEMPRTVNLVSGASRTADIEQTLINGAHGPKRLCVMIVDEALS